MGLQPKTVAVDCLRDAWNKDAIDMLAHRWKTNTATEEKDLWLRMDDGHTQLTSPFIMKDFEVQNSTTNADAHLLRLFLVVQANAKHVLASFDISNAFLNADLMEDVVVLTQPAPELIEIGLVKPSTLYQCMKACYGLREAPNLWKETRDKT